ncbi:ion transport protein [Ditylenchus destructor]|nr:ion transport protein [Ditylenchus destructor]
MAASIETRSSGGSASNDKFNRCPAIIFSSLSIKRPRAKMVLECLRRSKSVDHDISNETLSTVQQHCNGSSTGSIMYGRADTLSTDDTLSMAFKNGGSRIKTRCSSTSTNKNGVTGENDIITLNVSGLRFQTYDSTLRKFPNSLLGNPARRKHYWNPITNEYFFDRHRSSFEAILHIYQTGGHVIRPQSVPIALFLKELSFYDLGNEIFDNFWESEGYKKSVDAVMPKNCLQRRIWRLMEHPDSSIPARIFACVSVTVIIISIVSFCLETIPELKGGEAHREWSSPFFWIEFCCCLWFSVELILRFVTSPSKSSFMKSFLNILDFIAIAPFFLNLMLATDEKNPSISFSVLRIIRLVRVFRIFKLSRHSVGLQVLGKTFKASVREFCLLIFFMAIACILFSSGVYFAEQNDPDTKFTSIPASFWYVIATMTTVGYGDLVPRGVYGKIVGSCCALIGVLTLALPVPIIVANFKLFYRQECSLAVIYEQHEKEKNSAKATGQIQKEQAE